ncbi:PAAR domain-containing protein [Massilia sp. CCM 8734]|uniref:PAAR domain-containing protein n=1 Tax=Massilia sp. CCM 8734 TaxID=2609283 RepID=UPI00141EF657|nr:PAAR domain-containing protein [Massilia sp. CCM 8734]NHZ94487.1 hypothetical protein [Massilia sp. CCM 8734]
MPRAARLGDSIGHTPPGDGPIGGIGDVTGKIVGPCSSNVFTNGIMAARAYVDVAVCSLHPQAPLPIATGSSTVFINGLPAARVSDQIVCRAYITNGSGNVYIGGAAVQTNAFMPEGILDEALQMVENGATLALGAGEIVVGGLYNYVVRLGAGLASIPYMLDSVDAAVGVQKEIAEGLNYNFRSDGAKQIGEALKPVGDFVQENVTAARDFSEENIGLGATAIVFGGVEAGAEILGVVTGGRTLKSLIDFPLSGAKTILRSAGDLADAPAYSKLVSDFKKMPQKDVDAFYANMRSYSVEYEALIAKAMKERGLTPDEAHAVFGYTTKLFYRDLNQTLGAGGSKEANALADLINSGLQKMPSSGPVQYRGWRLDDPARLAEFDDKFRTGNTVESSFWSTAPDKGDAYSAHRNATIRTSEAKDISELSFGVNFHDKIGKPVYAAETIIPPGVKFRVLDSDASGNIILEQL